jgi:hypothetical protein
MLIITITNNNDNNAYSDKILINILTGNYEIYYSGQIQGQHDYKLINAIENNDIFKIYYRLEINKPFLYLGETNITKIIKNRSIPLNINANYNDKLLIHLIIKNDNILNINIPDNNFIGSGKYKKDIFIHANIPINSNVNCGFYKID